MLTKTIDKWIACFTAGGVLTMFTIIFGKMDYSIILLLIAMATDFITGIMCGIKSHELSSGKCFEGLCRKLMILIYVMLAHHLDVLLLSFNIIQHDFVRIGVCFMYIVNEIISIIENGTKLGVAVPKPIQNALEIINNVNDENQKED